MLTEMQDCYEKAKIEAADSRESYLKIGLEKPKLLMFLEQEKQHADQC